MDEFDVFKMFFKTPKDYITKKKEKPKVDVEKFRIEEVKDQEMFDSDEVAKCEDIDSFIC